jgi:hypothetical protein
MLLREIDDLSADVSPEDDTVFVLSIYAIAEIAITTMLCTDQYVRVTTIVAPLYEDRLLPRARVGTERLLQPCEDICFEMRILVRRAAKRGIVVRLRAWIQGVCVSIVRLVEAYYDITSLSRKTFVSLPYEPWRKIE